MSEFECQNHHLMPSSWGRLCRTCGAPVAYMDGMSNSQLRKMEKYEESREDNDDPEDEPEMSRMDYFRRDDRGNR